MILLKCCTSRDSKQLQKDGAAADAPIAPNPILGGRGGTTTSDSAAAAAATAKHSLSDGFGLADIAHSIATGQGLIPPNNAKPVQRWTVGWLPDEVEGFWRDHKTGFIEFWKKLRPQERVTILRKINPYMPTRPGDDFINGQYIGIASRLCPELSIDTLVKNQGVGLVELYEERVNRAQEAQQSDIQLVSKLISDGIVEGLSIDKLAAERETRILQHLNLIAHVYRQRFDTGEKSIWTELREAQEKKKERESAAMTAGGGGGGGGMPTTTNRSMTPTAKNWSVANEAAFSNAKPWSISDDPIFGMANVRNGSSGGATPNNGAFMPRPPPPDDDEDDNRSGISSQNVRSQLAGPNAMGKQWMQTPTARKALTKDEMRMQQLEQAQQLLNRMTANDGYLENGNTNMNINTMNRNNNGRESSQASIAALQQQQQQLLKLAAATAGSLNKKNLNSGEIERSLRPTASMFAGGGSLVSMQQQQQQQQQPSKETDKLQMEAAALLAQLKGM